MGAGVCDAACREELIIFYFLFAIFDFLFGKGRGLGRVCALPRNREHSQRHGPSQIENIK